MIVVRFLWYTLCIIFLFACMLIVIVGTLWVLRVSVYWWLEVDYVEKIKQKCEEKTSRSDS